MIEIDGNYTLKELESAILNKEAAANELTGLNNNGDSANPLTLVSFKKLSPGHRPKPLQLVPTGGPSLAQSLPVCSGTVFVQGKATRVSAFRNK